MELADARDFVPGAVLPRKFGVENSVVIATKCSAPLGKDFLKGGPTVSEKTPTTVQTLPLLFPLCSILLHFLMFILQNTIDSNESHRFFVSCLFKLHLPLHNFHFQRDRIAFSLRIHIQNNMFDIITRTGVI